MTELRELMETVPIELENLTEEVEHAVNDYELVEEFYYPLKEVFKFLALWLAASDVNNQRIRMVWKPLKVKTILMFDGMSYFGQEN